MSPLPVPNEERGRETLERLRHLVDQCPQTETIIPDIHGDELVTFLLDWGFGVGPEEDGARYAVHPDHYDLDLVIPMVERVSYRFTVSRAVELVDELESRYTANQGDNSPPPTGGESK